jgi:O-antigen ligase
MSSAKVGGEVIGALALAGALALLCTIAEDAGLALIVVPVTYLLIVFAMSRVPLRLSMLGLMAAALILPDQSDAPSDKFVPPFHGIGSVLFTHLNAVDRSLGLGWASFSGMDLLLVAALLIALSRRLSRSKIDRTDQVATPRPLVRLAHLALLSTAWVWALGMVRGVDFGMSLWQLNRVMYLPIIFLLFHIGLRGPKDLGAALKVVLFAGVYKSLLALYVVATIVLPPDPQTGSTRPAWALSHQDSILFAVSFVSVLAVLMERAVPRRQLKFYAALLPVLAAGTWANNRRMAWVQIALVFLTVYFISNNPIKRKLNRALYVIAPIIALYLLAGWSSNGRIFKPVRMLRSVVDPQSDSSTNWRELENFDIIMTFRMNPVFGSGYGHGYEEVIQLPAVDYSLERYAPHNSLLGLWAYCGLVGYATLTLLWVVGVYFALRTYYGSKDPRLRAAALVSFGTVLIYLVQCWGDLGLGTWNGIFTVAPALAFGGKLATAAGEWVVPKSSGNQRPQQVGPRVVQSDLG